MKSVKLKAIRVNEVAQLVDAIPTKDLGTMKEIRLASCIVKDLHKSIGELAEKASDLRVKQNELLKAEGFSERFAEETKDKTDEEKKEVEAKINLEFQMLVAEKFKDELAELDELNKAEVEVELGNEEFEKLKELFEKYCIAQYRV